jgi:hypothetical protein
MLVFTAVSSMKARRVESSSPRSRIQRRRARATSARCCSDACRTFFVCDVVAVQKTPQRRAAAADTAFAHHRKQFFKRGVRSFCHQRKHRFAMILQRRAAAAPRPGRASTFLLPELEPFDRRTDTDGEAFRSLTPRRSFPNRFDHPKPQIHRTSFGHRKPRSANHPQRLCLLLVIGNPDSNQPETALVAGRRYEA